MGRGTRLFLARPTGIVGVGEADTAPLLARTMIEMPSFHAVARGLREVLVGEDARDRSPVAAVILPRESDHYGRRGAALRVISAIDIALWDIAGKAAGFPVSRAARRPPLSTGFPSTRAR